MRGAGGPTVRLRRLSGELTRLRRESGFVREEVARRLGLAASTAYRIEAGQSRPQSRTIRDLLDLYGVEGFRMGDADRTG
ncbi:hypothetical protein GCM10010116_29650 [Microbispora rosea subsp. aerata]|nr:hypothetical protein GCM10010116_29650 [Microbispora rosea subsp. aerata]GIH55579.1 hypothetical protein Mro02_24930 [Microbispora rosea subsp. aerata]GLJ86579.1 hypothetical protein GCM10017588_53170 [Microbispora rosea subsp. aerata]